MNVFESDERIIIFGKRCFDDAVLVVRDIHL